MSEASSASDSKLGFPITFINRSNQDIYFMASSNVDSQPESYWNNQDKMYVIQDKNKLPEWGKVSAGQSTQSLTIPSQVFGGRFYFGIGKPLPLVKNDTNKIAGPNPSNDSDPCYCVPYEIIEFNTQGWFGNTSRVDQYGLSLQIGMSAPTNPLQFVGELISRAQIMQRYQDQFAADPIFINLLIIKNDTKVRIISPYHAIELRDKPFPNTYFDECIDTVWNKYKNEKLVFWDTDGDKFSGSVNDDDTMDFDVELKGQPLVKVSMLRKPTTKDVLGGEGALDSGRTEYSNDRSTPRAEAWGKVCAEMCAAFNRGLFSGSMVDGSTNPSAWQDRSNYYRTDAEPYNKYSQFFHPFSNNQMAYGFCYDDVADQAAAIQSEEATEATITFLAL